MNKKLKLEIKGNSNYTAKIFKIKKLHKHANADRLQCLFVDACNVITGTEAKEGDIYVYFPIECKINKDFLSVNNLFRNSELNLDKTQKGYFEDNCRVKATKLRGEKSEGFIMPYAKLQSWLCTDADPILNTYFDYIDDVKLVEKYIPSNTLSRLTSRNPKKPKESKIVEGQFRFHSDTEQLKRNIGMINPLDSITISYKLHGTSAVFSNILTKKQGLFYRLARKLKLNFINDKEYSFIYSSRKVIKNDAPVESHYYEDDIWGIVGETLKNKIPAGITLYGEIVGYLPSGAYIQKDYDYGCPLGKWQFYCYRVTYTNLEGLVMEMPSLMAKEFCRIRDIEFVPILFHGRAEELLKNVDYRTMDIDAWRKEFLDELIVDFNDQPCLLCKNNVPEEGIVLRIENRQDFLAFKLKSFTFLQRESDLLDKGEVDMETVETNE